MNSAAVAGRGILQAVNEEAVVVVSGKDDVCSGLLNLYSAKGGKIPPPLEDIT